jgi:hypothetical protein
MATRMQQRRGTAAQWTSADPILAAGEIGFETDTSKFKVGDGTNNWSDLTYFLSEDVLDGTLDDYILSSTKGQPDGVATLDGAGKVPVAQLGNLIADAPALLNTLEEIAAALGDDPDFASKVVPIIKKTTTQWTADSSIIPLGTIAYNTTLLGFKVGNGVNNFAGLEYVMNNAQVLAAIEAATPGILTDATLTGTVELPATTSIGTVTDDEIAHLSGVNGSIQGQLDAIETDVTTIETTLENKADLSNPTFTGTVALPSTTSIGDVSALEIGYLNGATSGIQTQLDAKLASATASSTYAPLSGPTFTGTVVLPSTTSVGDVSSTELGYVNGVTSAIQTQLDAKAPTADPTFTGTVSGVTKAHVGLGNVDNTTDANKPVSTATQTALDAKLNLSGGTLTGALTLSGAPTSDLHAATKQYVDGLAAGINFHQPVVAATTGNLAGTYSNGTNGLGATLTRASNGAIGTIDGATVSVGSRILLRAQTDKKENGVYTVTAVGSVSAPWVITRATDADNNPAGELSNGDFVFTTSGSTNGSKGFIVSTTGTITIGTTEIEYAQFNASEAVIAGTNISKTGETISVVNAPTFSGLVTASSGVAFSDGTQTKVGVPSISTITQKTSSYTLSNLNERDTIIEMGSSSALNFTVPTDSTLNYPIGTTLDVIQTGTGQVTVVGASGVTINATPGFKLRTQWSTATLLKRAANTWIAFGDLTA